MRVALKVYLTVERLMIEHDTLETTSGEEMELLNNMGMAAWNLLTPEERAELKKRDQPTREERNPTKIIFEGDTLYSPMIPVPLRVCAHKDLGSVPVRLSEGLKPAKDVFALTPNGEEVYRCYCGGITRHDALCCECARGNPDACCQNRNPHLVHCDVARRMAP